MRTSFAICVMLFAAAMSLADTLVMKDGARLSGTFVSANSRTIAFREGTVVHRYPRSRVQAIELGSTEAATTAGGAPVAAPPSSRRMSSSTGFESSGSPMRGSSRVTLPAGSEIAVLTNENIDSATAREGQTFSADVAENVVDSAGRVVIPKGSPAELVIRRASQAGTVTGTSDLVLDLQSLKVGGRRYVVSTQDIQQSGRAGVGKNRRTAEMVGGGALLGTLIGAVAGGGKGAAIGAATGAAAGAGTQVLTRGKAVKVPAESTLRFRLDEPLHLEAAY